MTAVVHYHHDSSTEESSSHVRGKRERRDDEVM
jgi:hypothetical protein